MNHLQFLFSSQRGKFFGLILHFRYTTYFNSFSHISTIINTIKQNIQISEKKPSVVAKKRIENET